MTISKSKPTSATKNSTEQTLNFEQAFAELEGIVGQMESGQMSLEASLAAFQRGNSLLQFCQNALANVEQQVQILNARNQLVQFKADVE
ncbi:MAG: exodeoxyribonuclease VII small subunit [Methylotenera sp.]